MFDILVYAVVTTAFLHSCLMAVKLKTIEDIQAYEAKVTSITKKPWIAFPWLFTLGASLWQGHHWYVTLLVLVSVGVPVLATGFKEGFLKSAAESK